MRSVVDAVQLERVHVEGLVADGFPRFGEVDDLRKISFGEVRVDRPKNLEGPAHGVLRQIGQLRPGEQLDNLRREIGPELLAAQAMLFRHFHLLAQFVADALQALPHRRFVHSGRLCQS